MTQMYYNESWSYRIQMNQMFDDELVACVNGEIRHTDIFILISLPSTKSNIEIL